MNLTTARVELVTCIQRTDIADISDMDSFRTGMITSNLNESGLMFTNGGKSYPTFRARHDFVVQCCIIQPMYAPCTEYLPTFGLDL